MTDPEGVGGAPAKEGETVEHIGVVYRIPVVEGGRDSVIEVLEEYSRRICADPDPLARTVTVVPDETDPSVVWLRQVFWDFDSYEDHFHSAARMRLRHGMDGLRGGAVEVFRVRGAAVDHSEQALREADRRAGESWASVSSEVT